MQEVTRTRNDRTTLFAAALLTFTALNWSGNYVLGRAIAEEVPAGDHMLRTWHYLQPEPALPVEQALHMNAGATQAAVKLSVAAAP